MRDARKLFITLLGAGILGITVLAVSGFTQVSASGESSASPSPSSSATASPSPTPSPSVTPIPPASAHTVRWAKKWRHKALVAWKEWNRARKCFSHKVVRFGRNSIRLPARSKSAEVWRAAGLSWKHDVRTYRHKFRALWREMNHPHGNAWEKWRPLVKWTWPAHLVNIVVNIIHYESSGAEFVYNHGGSGAYGLMQLLPRPAGVTYAYDQLVYAYWHKYVAAGYSFSPWAGCRAFSY